MANEETTVVAEATDETAAPAENETTEAPEATATEAPATEAAPETPQTAAQPELNEALAPAAGASEDAARAEVPGGRDYEVIFIVRVNESAEAATDRARTVIENNGGVVDNARTSEQRRLAYAIEKQNEGFYVVLNGRFSKEAAAELDRELKLDEAVLRHMTIRKDEA